MPENVVRGCPDYSTQKGNRRRGVAASRPTGVLWTARGYKPCYLWDVGDPTERGIAECLRLCRADSGKDDIRAFRLGRDDVLVCNVPETLRRLQDVAFRFVDVSVRLPAPTAPASPPVGVLAMLSSLERRLAEMAATPSRCDDKLAYLEPDREWNLCTAFGVLLGYPVVYWFEGGADAGNCLAMEELNVVRVRSSMATVGSPEGVRQTTASDDVYSFSYPAALDGELRPHVDAWWQRLRARAAANGFELVRVDELRRYPVVAL
ncbi:hypothetical protein MTO96_015145 [Rhipicephalus appendiculatus]